MLVSNYTPSIERKEKESSIYIKRRHVRNSLPIECFYSKLKIIILTSFVFQTFPLRPLPEHIPCDHTIARPQLSISQENATVRLTWNLQSTPMESIQNYEIYAYKQNATAAASDWKKV